MQKGMLWFDDHTHRDLKTKIMRAVIYFESKYGQRPTHCYVHPGMLLGPRFEIEGVIVSPLPTVLPNHFWIGVEEDEQQRPAA